MFSGTELGDTKRTVKTYIKHAVNYSYLSKSLIKALGRNYFFPYCTFDIVDEPESCTFQLPGIRSTF